MLVLASHNPNKTKVLQAVLTAENIPSVTAGELNLIEPEETGSTLLSNATLKALSAASATGKMALADDSGLCIPVLDGAPGVYTADWSYTKGGRDWRMAMERIHGEVHKKGADFPVTGAFVATLVLAWPDGRTRVFTGEQAGHVVWPPQGGGFALDPIFQPMGADTTLGLMDSAEAETYNHRAKVTRRVAQWIKAHCPIETSETFHA
jgi:XTP/dITP diphosphohydrolase